MTNEQLSIIDLVIETHADLERQGPGSPEMTIKALSFIDNLDDISKTVDLGCGSGGQTMVLAQQVGGEVIGLDLFPAFVDTLNNNAEKQNLGERVKGLLGSMDELPFEKESLDLIWSEGAIDNIGFERGMTHWHDFLKKNGHVVVTCPSWFTKERPAEIEEFWTEAGSGLDTVEHNIGVMEKAGYQFVAAFVLPEKCWTDNYFGPREKALRELEEKYAGNETAETFIADNRREVELYSKFNEYYGYAFYIGKKR